MSMSLVFLSYHKYGHFLNFSSSDWDFFQSVGQKRGGLTLGMGPKKKENFGLRWAFKGTLQMILACDIAHAISGQC